MKRKDSEDGPNMWDLQVDNMIDNYSWYWWWWIFFVRDPENPGRPKQLMILWSTKCTDFIKVMDEEWSLEEKPEWDGNSLDLEGMVAAWWYDGKNMKDPLFLEEADMRVEKEGQEGILKTDVEGSEYSLSGDPDKYVVKIDDPNNDFIFELTPFNDYLSEHRYNEKRYTDDYGYNIMKIYGMKLNGKIDGENVEGTAYFQRVCVDAPATPWYWAVVHGEDGSFLQYFNPFIGPQMFRTKKDEKSLLEWGDFSLSESILFYHEGTDKEYKFKSLDIQKELESGLPTFYVTGQEDGKKISIRLKAYSRAYWRFQQKRRFGMKQVFYYNEYPAEITDFSFESVEDSLKLEKEDIGEMYGNFEHSWGKLF
ncbi:MAG: hypothetical protein KGY76_00020 [Candidatus Thermoplasmatota archaeon]|nr:hypothetical protein [Candidatus Thermoplasmatota archaeon]